MQLGIVGNILKPWRILGAPVHGVVFAVVVLWKVLKMASNTGDDSLYPIAVLIDELRNEDVQVWFLHFLSFLVCVDAEFIYI